jgi:hypothetical protein
VEEKGMSKGWRRVIAISCTLLLVGSIFMVLGMTVWAQEQPPPTEQPAEQPAEQPVTTEQPAQTETTQAAGLTIDYWEPQVGTRTVYYTEDVNDVHGDIYGTSTLGYWDVDYIWFYRPLIIIYRVPDYVDFTSSYYYNVEAISNMNPAYFGLEGPWYFNMTTPFKVVETVKGIHEVPDAAQFPQATYAVEVLIIGSGGKRAWGTSYRSNDPNEKKWLEWGMTVEFFAPGEEYSTKQTFRYRSPSDRTMTVPDVVMTFPLSVGATGSLDAVYVEGPYANDVSGSATYEVIAEGKVTVPGGTFDALLLKGRLLEYGWFVQNVGFVADAESLPNEMGPLFIEATELVVLEEQTAGAPAPTPQQ